MSDASVVSLSLSLRDSFVSLRRGTEGVQLLANAARAQLASTLQNLIFETG